MAPLHYPDMRLFIGIPLAIAIADELKAFVARLRTNSDGLRWSAPESWHITLQFLGSTTPAQLECLTARLRDVRSAHVSIEMGEPGFFDRSGVFFTDAIVTPELAGLQQKVVAATSLCGFVPETRPYHPHITLARDAGVKRTREREGKDANTSGRGLRALKARVGKTPHFSRFIAQEFLLYESHLSSQGSRYEVRDRYPLVDR
jgi:RNA 2',3'-cyclic 3'-phosphodiesterase